MPNTIILLANGFEEIEAVTIIDVLRRANVELTVVGVEGKEVTGAHALRMSADTTIAELKEDKWDLVVLPGGLPGANTLRDNQQVQELLVKQNKTGNNIAAICAAPIALGKAGVLNGKQATCYPGFESELHGATHSTERVIKDGNVITSRGPGTAMEFALQLVRELVGDSRSDELRQQMLV